jgi:hypothetical protein
MTAKVNQTAVNFINESAKTQSINIRENGINITIDTEHQINVDAHSEPDARSNGTYEYDLVWVGGYRDAAYEIFPETIARVADELKSSPQRRSF